MEWWQAEGWASPPRRETARGPVTVYRAAGGGSNALGNCFFIPTRSLTGAVQGLTAQALEADLNAALWGSLAGVLSDVQDEVGALTLSCSYHDQLVLPTA